MSFLAMGSVTSALIELLTKKLNKPPLMGTTTTFQVTTLPPDDDRVGQDNSINLFLYKVAESPFAKNMNWRGDRSNPVVGDQPPLALTLDYLVTAYAKKVATAAQDDVTAHQLLGSAMAILHDYPVLNDIHDADFDANVDTQFAPELRDSFEKVKVSLLPTSMEDFSKIWTGLTKPYRLSIVYEVSLIEIGPIAPTRAAAPTVQTAAVSTSPFRTPQIGSVVPASGPAGAQVVINGKNLQASGSDTVVTIGGVELAAADLISLTSDKIIANIPSVLQRGPTLPITVSVGGSTSAAASYQVIPWIAKVVPLRGIPGIPIQIPFVVTSGATVSIQVDGQVATTTVDVAGATVTAIVPMAIATNGPKSVVLILNDGTPKTSNALSFEVMPLITSVSVSTTATPAQTSITLSGERLAAKDASVNVDGLLLDAGGNANAAQLVGQVNRLLSTTTPVSATIDGIDSNELPSQLLQIIPAAAFAGDFITIQGTGLSGRNVVVNFGATAVAIGPQAFTTQFKVRVPGELPAGSLSVNVSIDGRSTNSVSFTVTG
jgi:hypothetical protein